MKKNKKKGIKKRVSKPKEPKLLHSMAPEAYICIRPGTNTLTHPYGFLEYLKAVRQVSQSGGVVSNLKYVRLNFGPVALEKCTCCKTKEEIEAAKRLAVKEALRRVPVKVA